MLDRGKLFKALDSVADQLFIDISSHINKARKAWSELIDDATFAQKAQATKGTLQIPSWRESLNKTYTIDEKPFDYQVYSVDGSQVYPDRHQGTSCFLINIGSVFLSYGKHHGASFNSEPTVYTGDEEKGVLDFSIDMVNCKRHELELDAGLHAVMEHQKKPSLAPYALLFDGSLIFWHLAAKDVEVKNYFLGRYLATLQELFACQVLVASYISMPRSKELVHLVRLWLSDFDSTQECEPAEYLVDSHVLSHWLKPNERTIVFKNHAPIADWYPEHISPYFFYINVGDEIGRVEIPAYIAENQDSVDMVARIILDQSIKGYGYPISLAEAHEQAVVKGPDREFFYQLIQRLGVKKSRFLAISRKSMKKRRMGI